MLGKKSAIRGAPITHADVFFQHKKKAPRTRRVSSDMKMAFEEGDFYETRGLQSHNRTSFGKQDPQGTRSLPSHIEAVIKQRAPFSNGA